MTIEKEYIVVGKIVNTHGLKGEVKVLSQTDFKADRYEPKHQLYIDFKGEKIFVTVKKYRPHQGFDLLTFEEFDDINLVEKFKGSDLYAQKQAPIHLNPGEYQMSDLIVLNVLQGTKPVGVVEALRTYPQCDYLVIKTPESKSALVPFLSAFILDVNLDLKQILIVEMEGLI